MRSSLMAIETERDRYRSLYEGVGAGAADAQGKAAELTGQLEAERRLTTRALGAGRGTQPADRGAAAPARGDRVGAGGKREQGQGFTGPPLPTLASG